MGITTPCSCAHARASRYADLAHLALEDLPEGVPRAALTESIAYAVDRRR